MSGRTRMRLTALELDARINPVANDLFADAEALAGQSAITYGQNYDLDQYDPDTGVPTAPFTGEPGEPNHAGVSAPFQSAWYVWTAPISGRTIVDLQEFNGNDIAGAVYTGGPVAALTAVTSGSGSYDVPLTFDAVAGTTYHIAVDSPGDGLIDYQLSLSEFIPPANDAFAAAFPLSGAASPVVVAPVSTLFWADSQPGEPNHADGVLDHGYQFVLKSSVWYTWTAPTTGRATVALTVDYDFSNTGYVGVGTAVAVYTGGAVDALTKVANAVNTLGPDYGTNAVNVSFNSTAGTTYHIAAAGFNRLPSVVNLKVINQAVPGAVAVAGTLYVVGTGAADTVRVAPFGPATDGSSGVVVSGRTGTQTLAATVSGPVTAAELYLYDGTNTVDVAGSLAFPVRAELGNGSNTLRGGAGDTTVLAGNGTNVIRTGAGNDRLTLGRGNNVVSAGAGDDEVRVDSPRVIFFGDPVPPPGTGTNVIDAGAGNNRVVVTSAGPTVVITGAGNDGVNVVGGGPAVVSTGAGNDFVGAGGGNHVILTGAGDDTISIGSANGPPTAGTNVVDAGEGNDRVRVTSTGPTVVFAGAGDDDVTIGFRNSFDTTPFQSGPSTVFGGAGNDVLLGGSGKDYLDGGAGNDLIAGGLGADTVIGGAGNDLLFDGTVTTKGFPDTLRKVLTDWTPADPASYATIRGRITVSANTASRDVLTGGAGTDWLWSADPLDVLDLGPAEVRN